MLDSDYKQKIILADQTSGIEMSVFTVSVLALVVKNSNQRFKFKFPFWAFSGHVKTASGIEWGNNRGYQRVSAEILKSIKSSPGLSYFQKMKESIVLGEKTFEKIARNLLSELENLNDQELLSQYKKFIKHYVYFFSTGAITFLYENNLSEKLIKSLSSRYSQVSKLLPQLLASSYRSFILLSEDALFCIHQEKNEGRRGILIQRYLKNFFYIQATYAQAPVLTEKFVRQQARGFQKILPKVNITSPLKLKSWEKQVVNLLRVSEVIHDRRKQINMIGNYLMLRLIDEVARRHSINKDIAKRAFWFEYPDLILSPNKILPILKKRQKVSIIFDGYQDLYYNYLALQERTKSNLLVKKILGTPASSGLYQGLVHLVLTRKDFLAFRHGEILVTTMTRPKFLEIIKKAGAIITDEGGLTSHAAIIAREFNKPCIVGAKKATKILKNGDLVEVNARDGIIKIINKK